MAKSFDKILNCDIYATGEKVGTLDDILFNDDTWKIRYLVIKFKENFLKSRRVLVHTNAIVPSGWGNEKLQLTISKDQLMNEPSVDADLPVFRQMEKKYFDFYNWPYYWDDMGNFGIDPRARIEPDETHFNNEPKLRSARIVTNYFVRKDGDKIASVEDILFNEQDWKIVSFVVKRNLFFQEEEIKTEDISLIDWFDRSVHLKKEWHTGSSRSGEEEMTF